jgi:hypothetical protein
VDVLADYLSNVNLNSILYLIVNKIEDAFLGSFTLRNAMGAVVYLRLGTAFALDFL